ncbi:MAG: KTSC domain-containing protein [Verrucomicrobiia bacterium]|jgi:hypothetical protein
MERIPVQSSNIASVGYDADGQTLEVEFLHGGVYQYFGVPQAAFDDFMNAPSKGSYFQQNIRNAYSCSKVG